MTIRAGWLWEDHKGNWRPIVEFREIRKGKNAGKFEVTLPAAPSRKVIVERGVIRSFPVETVKPPEKKEPGLFEVKEGGSGNVQRD